MSHIYLASLTECQPQVVEACEAEECYRNCTVDPVTIQQRCVLSSIGCEGPKRTCDLVSKENTEDKYVGCM